MANQRIKANLIPSCDIYPVIHLAQYDVSDGTGKQVEIELYYGTDKFTIPSGSSITFRGTKRDKTGYSYEITKFTDNVVTVDVKPQMTVLSGTHFAELRISKGNTISNTIKFVMKIDSSALADDTKVSETDLSVIEKALQASDSAIQAKAEVEQLKASVEKSEKNAKQSETNASQSATNAQESAESASTSAATASTKATEASTSATKAKESETNAQSSAESAIQTKAEVEQLKKETVEQTKTLTDSAKQEISTVKDATVLEVTRLKTDTISDITSIKDRAVEEVTVIKDDAKAEADKAKESETNAKLSETNASNSAKEAKESAESVANVVTDVSKIKEDIGDLKDKKITKFYASNLGETHITDSDKGLIQDMNIYGQSKQDGEPSPSNPVEIKNVVNPKMSVCGSNILQKNKKYINPTKFDGNVTLNDDESISYEGSISNAYASIYIQKLTLKKGTYQLLANQYSSSNDIGAKLIIEKASGNTYILDNKPFIIDADNIKCRLFISSEAGHNYPLTVSGTVKCALIYSGSTTDIQPYIEQSVTLPITLNAIPVSSGGNVTINGQQYIADYVDVEKRKLHRKVKRLNLKDVDSSLVYHGFHSNGNGYLSIEIINAKANGIAISNQYKYSSWTMENGRVYISNGTSIVFVDNRFTDKPTAIGLIKDTYAIYELQAQVEEDLTSEQVEALKMLSTYYPVTNITVGSEELYGYTVFNYPISMANGWNYVKQQLNDNRDYIYDMDLQSAEAYVNSEYAVTLTELEV